MLLGPGLRPAAKTSCAARLLGLGATTLIGLGAAAPAAHAHVGGASTAPTAPSIASMTCRGGCGGAPTVRPGDLVTLRGRNLDRARAVVFLGGPGRKDDVRVRVAGASATRLRVRVPAKARSGRIAAVDARGATVASRVTVRVVRRAAEPEAAPTLAPVRGLPQLDAGVALRRAGKLATGATVAYRSQAAAPVTVRLDVVRVGDGLSVFTDERVAAPNAQETVVWEGRTASGVAPDGRYELRLSVGEGTPATTATESASSAVGGASLADATAPEGSVRVGAFTFASAVFPVRGPHDYGQSGARFGAGRGGRSHEGQDVMARCGTPVVAARGGVVRQSTYHGAAGNYVVIDDPLTGESHAYMHFRDPALVRRGDRVATGQQIGVVGSTGSSTACHLHFELWTAPGWYRGGRPVDPLPTLKRWDRLG